MSAIEHILSLEEVEQAIAESRTRGGYLMDVKDFFKSGELAIDFSEKYPAKESGSLRNSIDQNCKKVEERPQYQIVMVPNGEKKHVVLINMDVYHLQKQENEA